MEEFDYNELRIATDEFSPTRIIGKGSHGCVYKANLPNGRVTAVKKLSSALQNTDDNSKLDNEILILSSLLPTTTTKLINIVRLLGVSSPPLDNTNKVMIVMEYMPNGTLHDLLHHNNTTTTTMTWPRRVRIAIQIARAIQYLHGVNIVHRDIKSSNVLFDKEWTAKLADFGLALRSSSPSDGNEPRHFETTPTTTPPAGTIGYIDPTYTDPSKFSTKNDVFSFGILLLEIISRRKAFDVEKSPPSLVDWVPPLINQYSHTRSSSLEKVCDKLPPVYMYAAINRVLSLAVRCISVYQEDRPSMDEVVVELESCYKEVVMVGSVIVMKWSGLLRFAKGVVMEKGWKRTWKMVVRGRKRRTVPAIDTVVDIAADTTVKLNCKGGIQVKNGKMLKDFLADVDVSGCNITVELN